MNCSPCAVCSLNLAENHFGKTHETMWRSFLNLPFLPHPPSPHGQSISKAYLSLIWNIFTCLLLSIPLPSPRSQPPLSLLGCQAATSLLSLTLEPPFTHLDNLCVTARGIFQKCESEHIALLPIILRLKSTWPAVAHAALRASATSQHSLPRSSHRATQALCDFLSPGSSSSSISWDTPFFSLFNFTQELYYQSSNSTWVALWVSCNWHIIHMT